MNKRGLSTSLIIIIVVVVLLVLGGIGFFAMKGNTSSSVAVPSSELSKCLSLIDESKLPTSLGGFQGQSIKLTKSFNWEGPDNKKVSMPVEGYVSIYKLGTKSNTASVMTFKENTDYSKITSDFKTVKDQDKTSTIKETSVKGAKAYVIDNLAQKTSVWYVLAGDKKYAQFGFTGVTSEEAQTWVDTWANTVCS